MGSPRAHGGAGAREPARRVCPAGLPYRAQAGLPVCPPGGTWRRGSRALAAGAPGTAARPAGEPAQPVRQAADSRHVPRVGLPGPSRRCPSPAEPRGTWQTGVTARTERPAGSRGPKGTVAPRHEGSAAAPTPAPGTCRAAPAAQHGVATLAGRAAGRGHRRHRAPGLAREPAQLVRWPKC